MRENFFKKLIIGLIILLLLQLCACGDKTTSNKYVYDENKYEYKRQQDAKRAYDIYEYTNSRDTNHDYIIGGKSYDVYIGPNGYYYYLGNNKMHVHSLDLPGIK